mmetsp:Transcript_8904/g.18169  ORF Transcript_8904/g.18169 Transcript_8904/m.18169 type:complete len:355 (+) Transcript_8904:75-1139(+)|eukprot:CAMPEP_0178724840 /NCGR_PEP_ID=MMETSP0699-20121125/26318_1 /TAXON_ID=265572 /ORGANISM="Extubocellulus spinifer, Strain CCMP396" /LENGTH=354 /DNA_ID=CAMNT_0020376061 /DNA_START=235 /DNA_END=1299 /DNA_ORIENTATION=-
MGIDQILPISPAGSALSAVDEHGSFGNDNLEEGARALSNSPPGVTALSVDTTCETIASSAAAHQRALSTVSDKYDRDHKGWLDPTERRMRELDKAGKGHLDNSTVYNMMKESMTIQKTMVTQRWLMLGLGVFALILAISNMGTALIAARLTKETEVTPAGDLASKHNHERLGTTARAMTYDLGTSKHIIPEGKDRRLGLLGGTAQHELVSFNVLALGSAKELWNSVDTDGSSVHLRWTCGIGGGGSTFSAPVASAECTPYSLNSTDTARDQREVSGIFYEYEVRRNRFVIKTLKVDCVHGASDCVVTGTDCCGSSADCGDGQKCSMCGCQCVDMKATVPMCISSPSCGGANEAW